MRLSLSVRIAETAAKDRMTMPFADFALLAKETGYQAVCIRASAGGVQTQRPELLVMRRLLDGLGLAVRCSAERWAPRPREALRSCALRLGIEGLNPPHERRYRNMELI